MYVLPFYGSWSRVGGVATPPPPPATHPTPHCSTQALPHEVFTAMWSGLQGSGKIVTVTKISM